MAGRAEGEVSRVCSNSLILLLVKGASWLEILIAMGIIILSMFALLYDWGPGLDSSFLLGPCLLVIMIGLSLWAIASLGLQGIRLLYTRVGVFSGHIIIGLYFAVFIIALAGEVKYSNSNPTDLNIIVDLGGNSGHSDLPRPGFHV